MIILPDRIRDATIVALEQLAKRKDIPQDALIDLQIAAGVLSYSRHLTTSGTPTIREHCAKAVDWLAVLATDMAQHDVPQAILDELALLQRDARAIAEDAHGHHELQNRFAEFLVAFDRFFVAFSRTAPQASQAVLTALAEQIMAWQVGLNFLAQVPATVEDVVKAHADVQVEDLQTLLRDRMHDASLTISEWTRLSGGFSKETCLFKVEGDKVNAELVMRRDGEANVIKGVDCHEVKQEYPLLKALFELGFPVPEPLLLETDSTVVKGPDFMIVRRVAGKVEGDQFGAEGKVAEAIQRELAKVTARLHDLPPILQLGDSSRELRPELWTMTTADCARDYIGTWYGHYLASPHMPIPAMHSMLNWLLCNVPESDERPAMVHGDIGLHNLLFHEGQLSTVLDWEFAHIGDPAEDLGIIYATMSKTLDWESFLDEYRKAGHRVPSMLRVRYFEIWMYFRNLCIASMALEQFASGRMKQIRFAVFATRFVPHYIERVSTLIQEWND